ncbi:antitoxin Xre/MbcA/ParS toxin-binding domain-containing protein [Algoriphagus marinus]|uniref:antitoxin Xre/MbcA/ParS toxin-binding domain-containing protein n=1 Tax=Algoriphagus marinus TaxID=1925762 RepID=UPI00094B857F|nr:antitoxin Xre/MbcA/ParS toxin-binding domain-containing protein [Algoriphagus marinus]
MAHAWKISFGGQDSDTLLTGQKPYHFFNDSPIVANEPELLYGEVLDFKDTSVLFDFLEFTQADISELLEVDPSTLFRWKKDEKKLSKVLTKNILDMDKVIAKGIRIFGSEQALADWLQTSNSSLGNQKPAQVLKNPYGIELVDQAMEAMSWGAIL